MPELSALDDQIKAILAEIGNNIRDERKKSHITREKMEDLTGVSIDTIKRIEAGKASSIENVLRIAAVLHISFPLPFGAPRDKQLIWQEIDKLLDELLRSK